MALVPSYAPHMAVACGKRGVKLNENHDRTTIPAANMEQDIPDTALDEKGFKGFDSPVSILVVSYRKRKHDPDGVSVKAVLDGIVALGILADDSSEQVSKITFESRKTEKGEKEKTVIILDDGLC